MPKNQVYFDLAEFANDLFEVRAKRKATYKDIATEANTTVTIRVAESRGIWTGSRPPLLRSWVKKI